MIEDTFKTLFIANFLASWTAEKYNTPGQMPKGDSFPVEDSAFYAEAAWQHWKKIMTDESSPTDDN